jgi:exodeoxyribonuclease VII large subunit
MSLFDQLTFLPPRKTRETPAPETSTQEAAPVASPAAEPPRIWSVQSLVSAVTRHIEQQFADVRVEGEISNCRPAPSGHLYFTLKDGDAQLACVLFRSRASLLKFRVQDGLQVQARGRISVYEGRGQMQLIADSLQPLGDGAFRIAYERLRERLQNEGLFDAGRKRPLPAFAANIGVITSPTGSVIQDILNVLARRHSGMNVLIYPATVQGPTAATEFIAGLEWFQSRPNPVDAIVLARGGGSIEDLHCFNHEALARALAASTIPTISAIGHETDFTIADFVADLRAPTPSAAAELITAQHVRIEQRVAELDRRAERAFRYRILLAREALQGLLHSPALLNARDLSARRQQRLDDLCQRLAAAQRTCITRSAQRVHALQDRMVRRGLDRQLANVCTRYEALATRLSAAGHAKLTTARSRFRPLAAQLNALSPTAILQRGYALVYDASGKLLREVAEINIDDIVSTRLATGSFASRVTQTTPATETQ